MKLFTCLVVALAWGTCTAFAADESLTIPLWTNGAPGFENRGHEAERAESYWVRNVHNPSITVFLPPREKATGAAC